MHFRKTILKTKKVTFLNDPIYGFISIQSPLIFRVISHPWFQRLRRISQMGLSSLVYPGAHHTRFEHALGGMHLMQEAIRVLRKKEVLFSDKEVESMQLAILLHDIGHGPFSHTTEATLVGVVSHEEISRHIMEKLNEELNGALEIAIAIFTNDYHRKFMHQLIVGQVDLDRMDYLKRDSFYSGATEGNINSKRIIEMMTVVDDQLVFDEKCIYSIEKFLMARRLMYWQVYLHKTSISAELLLVRVLERVRHCVENGNPPSLSPSLSFFMSQKKSKIDFSEDTLENFLSLDDSDIIQGLKVWQYHDDFILSKMSKMLIERNLLKIKIQTHPFDQSEVDLKNKQLENYSFNESDYHNFVFTGSISNQAYAPLDKEILILLKNGKLTSLQDANPFFSSNVLSQLQVKYYLCYPRDSNLS